MSEMTNYLRKEVLPFSSLPMDYWEILKLVSRRREGSGGGRGRERGRKGEKKGKEEGVKEERKGGREEGGEERRKGRS